MRLAVNDQKASHRCSSTSPPSTASRGLREVPRKGRAIAVTGRLIYREWVADDGTRRSKHTVVGHVQFGGRPNDIHPSDNDHTDDHEASF